jgi:solute:Na+ symporter, SSS family
VNIPVFLAMFSVLGIIYLILGIAASTKIKNVTDYFLASRDLGLQALTFTLVATQIGGGMLLGTADASYKVGYYGIFYTLGMSIGFIILGFGLASKLRSFNVATTAELFEVKYKSAPLRKIASLASALCMIGLLVGQIVASHNLFNALGIGSDLILFIFWIFVIVYTVTGGLKAVVITDVFQVVFLIAIVTGAFFYVLSGEGSSFFSISTMLERQSTFSFGKLDLYANIPILVASALYPLFGQDLAQRFFSAKTKKVAAVSALLASLIMILFSFVPVYFGMKAKMMGFAIPEGTSVFMSVVSALCNDVVVALIACALVAAVTSTADSLLCAISSNIAQDFDYSGLTSKSKLFISKVVTVLAGCIAMVLAYYSSNILGVLIQSYELLISSLFVSVFVCFFTSRLEAIAAYLSIGSGILAFGILNFVPFSYPEGTMSLIGLIVPLAISSVAYLIGHVGAKLNRSVRQI